MSRRSEGREEIVDCLKGRGHSPEEIEKILECLAAHDEATLRDVLFDELGQGSALLESLIALAIGEHSISLSATAE